MPPPKAKQRRHVGTARRFKAPKEKPRDFGFFEGPVQARWLPDGRRMALLAPLVFHQRNGPTGEAVWTAPIRSLTDGATIPPVFWSVIGGPFEGKYRDAAVNHDYECCMQTHAWHTVHRMFYDGMRANGEDAWRAKLMYFAVYFFGPRWPASEKRMRRRFSEGDIARVARLVQQRPDISLEEIESLNQRSLRARVPNKPDAMRGASSLSDSKAIAPVARDGPCLAPNPG